MIYNKYNILVQNVPTETNKTKINKTVWRKKAHFCQGFIIQGVKHVSQEATINCSVLCDPV